MITSPLKHSSKRVPETIRVYPTLQVTTNKSIIDDVIQFNTSALWRFLRLNKKESFHIVHCHGNGALGIALLKKLKLLKIPFVYTVHGGVIASYRAYLAQHKHASLLKTILYKLYCTMEKFWCRTADRVIVTSNIVKTDVERYYGINCKKLSFIIDSGCEPVKELSISKDPFFLCVGRLEETKNFDKVIIAMRDITRQYPLVRLFIVGNGSKREKLKKLVHDLKLDNNVLFKGFISEKELNRLYDRAFAVIHPSLLEGVSNVIVEALAHGTFVIASRESGAPDILGDNNKYGYVLKKATPDELAKYMALFLKEKTKYIQELSESLRMHSLKYTFKINALLHLNLYRSLLIEGLT